MPLHGASECIARNYRSAGCRVPFDEVTESDASSLSGDLVEHAEHPYALVSLPQCPEKSLRGNDFRVRTGASARTPGMIAAASTIAAAAIAADPGPGSGPGCVSAELREPCLPPHHSFARTLRLHDSSSTHGEVLLCIRSTSPGWPSAYP